MTISTLRELHTRIGEMLAKNQESGEYPLLIGDAAADYLSEAHSIEIGIAKYTLQDDKLADLAFASLTSRAATEYESEADAEADIRVCTAVCLWPKARRKDYGLSMRRDEMLRRVFAVVLRSSKLTRSSIVLLVNHVLDACQAKFRFNHDGGGVFRQFPVEE